MDVLQGNCQLTGEEEKEVEKEEEGGGEGLCNTLTMLSLHKHPLLPDTLELLVGLNGMLTLYT